MSGPLYLGVDLGSQSLKLFIIDGDLKPVVESNVKFDRDLPHFRTTGGFHVDGHRVTGPTLMWIEALERCFADLAAQNAPLDRVVAISGAAQQHGSVYWKRGALRDLQSLDAKRTLTEQLGASFAVQDSPVWMDSSTTTDCLFLESKVGGADAVAATTGSRAFERFTGNQIAKLLRTEPEAMEQCERIALISSFLASLLTGGYAPIDVSDGSGMNLLDIRSRTWSPDLINVVAEQHPSGTYNLGSRLGEVVESFTCIGQIAPYFANRFGLPATCSVIAFSGDNNNALVGLKLRARDIAVSMGTSDTIFATLAKASPKRLGHVFAHPVFPGKFMAMLCYANGSLTREDIRDAACRGSWDEYEAALERTPAGNAGNIGYYFIRREIVPQGGQGVHRFDANGRQVENFAPDADVRAIVEGQFLSMRLHAAQLGLDCDADETRIFVTGGGSKSRATLQVLADVFGVKVYRDAKSAANSAAFGAALRACHGYRMLADGSVHADSETLYTKLAAAAATDELLATPVPAHTAVYNEMLPRYEKLEKVVMKHQSKL